MNIKKIWTKLFTENSKADEIALHISGATVRHRNPFEHIEVPRNNEELTEEFVSKWVIPFYMNIPFNLDDTAIETFAKASKAINKDIVLKLLSDFDWRPRIAGAFFAAINKYPDLEDLIGRHLLKSEVCYAGTGYCLALANFGTDISKDYLATYLDYYLDRVDLWFDQGAAFCALEYLDKAAANKFNHKWELFVADKDHWNLENTRILFSASMSAIEKIRRYDFG